MTAKAPTGGIVRTSLDNTWQTPPFVLERARVYFRGPIPFDPLTAPDNPTNATRFCAGVPGTLFAQGDPVVGENEFARKNGLEVSWDWPFWVNPPYGTELREAVAKDRGAPANDLHGAVLEELEALRERVMALVMGGGAEADLLSCTVLQRAVSRLTRRLAESA